MKRENNRLRYLAITFVLFVSACRPSVDVTDLFVAYHTTSVKARSAVMIRFKENMNPFLAMDSLQVQSSVTIEPKVDVQVYTEGNSTLVIRPKQAFDNDTQYKVTLKVKEGKCYLDVNTPKVVMRNNAEVILSEDQEYSYMLKGSVITSDYVDNQRLESSVSYKSTLSGMKATMEWTHSEDGTMHDYLLQPLVSDNEDRSVTVSGEFEEGIYVIPAKGNFRVTSAKVNYDPFSIDLFFSGRLSEKNNYANAVSLEPSTDFRTTAQNNKLTLYPRSRIAGDFNLAVDTNLSDVLGNSIQEPWSCNLSILSEEPSISFISKGMLLPSGNNMSLLVRSVNYAQMQVRVRQIFENNILQFLQDNEMDEGYSLYNVSRIVADTLITLADPTSSVLRVPSNFGIQLSKLIKAEPGAIYRVEVRGREPLIQETDYYESDYWFGDYETYDERSMNVLATNYALVVKGVEGGDYQVMVNDIMMADPVQGVRVSLYDRVNQEVGSGTTNQQGIVTIHPKEVPFVVVAEGSKEKSYLKITENNAINTSDFKVDGVEVAGGMKTFVFGERGVWRPGDSLFLSVITSLLSEKLPDEYPLTAQLYNPQGQMMQEQVQKNHHDGLFTFRFATNPDDLTGRWSLRVKVGSEWVFYPVRVETVKPNRLALNLDFDNSIWSYTSQVDGTVDAQWLYGAPGANLETRVEASISKATTQFDDYKQYTFEDPARVFYNEDVLLAEGVTNADGRYAFHSALSLDVSRAPGFLKANCLLTVFEKGGDFSTSSFSTVLSPYKTYVGLYANEEINRWGDTYLDVDKTHTFNVVALSPRGTPKKIARVEASLYKLSWNWWWNATSNGLANYFADNQVVPIKTLQVKMNEEGKGSFTLNGKELGYGLYYVQVKDPEGNHAAAKMYSFSNSYASVVSQAGESATRLSSSLDQEKYTVGQTAVLTIPSAQGAHAVVSIEKGRKILKTFTVDCQSGQTPISIPLTKDMVPNAYAFVTLIQPHGNTNNDAPIRMYCVQPLMVENPSSVLTPVIETAEKIRPLSKMKVTVKESSSKAMSYVLAVVDEGLLNITSFKTPNPWEYFFSKEALAMRTWDSYDKVIGAYGGMIEQFFAIGGDDALSGAALSEIQTRRFEPVVRYLGPFHLAAGKSATHELELPQYFGSLRAMVVATDGEAYGSAQKQVQVTKPLLVTASLPRTLATEEEVLLPVTVIATENQLGKVNVRISAEDALSVINDSQTSIQMTTKGEQVVFFRLKASEMEGIGRISVQASSSSDSANEKTNIEVLDPNPRITLSQSVIVQPGTTWRSDVDIAGKKGTQAFVVEASSIPSIDWSHRLDYLTDYPYGCVEQLVSGAFPNLYLNSVIDGYHNTDKVITRVIEMLPKYQMSSGAFAYWTNQDDGYSPWGTIYATHFLIEATNAGYSIPGRMREDALSFLSRFVNREENSAQQQAYALYVLALAGKARRGEMNRLRENLGAGQSAKWFLALAYVLSNNKDVAGQMLASEKGVPAEKNIFSADFGSEDRNLAVVIQTLLLLDRKEEAFTHLQLLAKRLNDKNYYMSTQSCTWALNAVAAYVKQMGKAQGINAEVSVGEGKEKLTSDKAVMVKDFAVSTNKQTVPVVIQNTGESVLHFVLSSTGVPSKEQHLSASNGLELSVTYLDMNGNTIYPAHLEQGTDFIAKVRVRNTSSMMDYTHLALTQRFPSSWEIRNHHLYDDEMHDGITYQDIRDDRVNTFFDLPAENTLVFDVQLTATYQGVYYLPAQTCEAMYQGNINATIAGEWLK